MKTLTFNGYYEVPVELRRKIRSLNFRDGGEMLDCLKYHKDQIGKIAVIVDSDESVSAWGMQTRALSDCDIMVYTRAKMRRKGLGTKIATKIAYPDSNAVCSYSPPRFWQTVGIPVVLT